ncbi:hypothetical protein F0562_013772 [Nyssa sinensis]|uniref:HMG box domain-containing protein n=1 Tax=Nyssa sinensis TaxID=561372 RepID=A0A5J4ZP58_9ASTE|nr:hypothetical protein F0562_013772 [Nyssa sinensis]
MTKKATKSQKSASASASARNPTKVADGKMVLKIKSTENMKKAATKQGRPKSVAKPKTVPKKKAAKIDAKKPKKPPTAFFYFLEDFRKEFQEQNPDVKSMRDIGKACGEKWKTMTYEEKVQYYDIATEKRAEFDRAMADYIKRKESGEDQQSEESEFDE